MSALHHFCHKVQLDVKRQPHSADTGRTTEPRHLRRERGVKMKSGHQKVKSGHNEIIEKWNRAIYVTRDTSIVSRFRDTSFVVVVDTSVVDLVTILADTSTVSHNEHIFRQSLRLLPLSVLITIMSVKVDNSSADFSDRSTGVWRINLLSVMAN